MTENTSLFDLILAACRGIGNAFVALWHFCGKCVRLSLRKWYITLPMVVAGIALGIWASNWENRFWRVEATAILNGSTPELVSNRYNNLNKLFPTALMPAQSKPDALGWEGNPNECYNFMKFESFPVIDCLKDSVPDYVDIKEAFDPTDTVSMIMQNRLFLRFVTRDLHNIAKAEQAVLDYLNSDPQLIAAFETHKANLEWEAAFCDRQVNLLDSFTTQFYFFQGAEAHIRPERFQMFVGDRDITLLHPEILLLLEHKKYVDRELALCTAPVVLESGFMVSPRAINRRSNSIAIGFAVFYLLSLLISVLVEQRHAIRNWAKK